MPEWLILAAFVGIVLLLKLADRRSDIRREKALEEADARAKARRPDWVDKRHNCCEVKVLIDLEQDAHLIVQTRAEQLEGSGEPLPECDGHREEPGFHVKREGGGFVSFSLRFFPESGGLKMYVSPPDGAETFEWCIHVRSGRNSPCVLVLEMDDSFPRSGETPPEQVKALDAVCGEELDHQQLLYKVLGPILFGGQRAAS